MAEKKILAKLLCLNEMAILAYTVHIENGSLQLGMYGWRGSYSLHHYIYLIPSRYDRKNVVTIANDAIVAVIKKPVTVSQ